MWNELHTFGVVHMFPKNVQILWGNEVVMKLHTFGVVNMFPKYVQLLCVQICAKSPKNEANTMEEGSIKFLHTNLCKISQK